MKKRIIGFIMIISLGLLVGCGKQADQAEKDDKVIKVAVQTSRMSDVMDKAVEIGKKDGWTVQLIQVNDNIQYNEMLKNKEIDANFVQHEPFMEKFNKEKQANLVVAQKIYDAKVGYYSKNYQDIADLPDGAKIAIPNDISNEGRALAILDDAGLIKLKEGVGYDGTTKDIVENPKHFEWLLVDLLNLSEAYNEKDVAMIYNYPAYLYKLGLKPKDAILLENQKDDHFAISLVAREDNQHSEKIKALKKMMTDPAVKKVLIEKHGDTLIPTF